MERVGLEFKNLDSTISDIVRYYHKYNTEDLQLAIKYGALGKYGRTYRLSTQEVCIWIDSYLEHKRTKGRKPGEL